MVSPQPRMLTLQTGERAVTVVCVRNPRARRYILRMRSDGVARVTVPRGGSIEAAWDFARRHDDWIERQVLKRAAAARDSEWSHGMKILFRGERVELTVDDASGSIRVGDQIVAADATSNRARVERHLARLAERELPQRTRELALCFGVTIGRVTVRNQRTRWGSCSVRGTISLNWRLIQTPPAVRDYIILHELMHTREMNHSPRFWAHVQLVCPEWRAAEQWLRKHGTLLRD